MSCLVQVPDTEAPKIVYDTKGSTMTKFRAEVRDGVLRISERRDSRRAERTAVTVYYNTLQKLTVQEASVSFDAPFRATLFDLVLGSSAQLKATLDVADPLARTHGQQYRGDAHRQGPLHARLRFGRTGRCGRAGDDVGRGQCHWVVARRAAGDRPPGGKNLDGRRGDLQGQSAVVRTDEKFMGGSIAHEE